MTRFGKPSRRVGSVSFPPTDPGLSIILEPKYFRGILAANWSKTEDGLVGGIHRVYTRGVAAEFEGMRFEWDDDKAEANIGNLGGVTFFEAATVFTDPLSIIVENDEHSVDERRFLTVGRSTGGRVLIVCYTERETLIRIISAREAEPKEVRAYEDGE